MTRGPTLLTIILQFLGSQCTFLLIKSEDIISMHYRSYSLSFSLTNCLKCVNVPQKRAQGRPALRHQSQSLSYLELLQYLLPGFQDSTPNLHREVGRPSNLGSNFHEPIRSPIPVLPKGPPKMAAPSAAIGCSHHMA